MPNKSVSLAGQANQAGREIKGLPPPSGESPHIDGLSWIAHSLHLTGVSGDPLVHHLVCLHVHTSQPRWDHGCLRVWGWEPTADATQGGTCRAEKRSKCDSQKTTVEPRRFTQRDRVSCGGHVAWTDPSCSGVKYSALLLLSTCSHLSHTVRSAFWLKSYGHYG